MRILLSSLAAVSILFSAASFADVDQQAISAVEKKLNSPIVKQVIADQLNMNASELGNMKVQAIDVASYSESKNALGLQIQAQVDGVPDAWPFLATCRTLQFGSMNFGTIGNLDLATEFGNALTWMQNLNLCAPS